MSTTDDFALPLLFVWGIPAYLLAGYVGILQFKIVFSLLISAMTSRGGGQLWKTVKKCKYYTYSLTVRSHLLVLGASSCCCLSRQRSKVHKNAFRTNTACPHNQSVMGSERKPVWFYCHLLVLLADISPATSGLEAALG